MFDGFEKNHVEINGISINYVKSGTGDPLLLLHGYPQNLYMWARVAPILSEKYTVVCADLRGYGDSGKPRALPDASNYSFRNMASDNVQLMQHLGFDEFHLVGHDRGGRTAHRMALDHTNAVRSLAVLDIVPTYSMFTKNIKKVAELYWHWYFLSQPAPFPEQIIGMDPDSFYEACLFGWGAMSIDDFSPDQLNEYRRSWRNLDVIHGSCNDYRAANHVDFDHDSADLDQKILCPTLVLYGADGAMAKTFDLPAEWKDRAVTVTSETLSGGHFFVDQYPEETAQIIRNFLDAHFS